MPTRESAGLQRAAVTQGAQLRDPGKSHPLSEPQFMLLHDGRGGGGELTGL